tara:strand:+ start:4925 stop:6094 length:1170 start_codon:yes stop_codon:yes gene_type:complete
MPKDELSPEEAQKIVKKFCKPPYDPDEAKLKEAAWTVLKECNCGAFEWDGEDEEEKTEEKKDFGTKEGMQTAQQEVAVAETSKGIVSSVKEYGLEIASNIQNLGAAGSVALSSATYFQAETVVESTEDIAAIVQEVEIEYDQTLSNYFVETTATFIDDISDTSFIQAIPVVNTVVASTADSLYSVSDDMESVEEKTERIEKQKEEQEAKEQAKAEAKAEKAEAKAKAKTEKLEARKAEREAAKEERRAEKEAKSEENKSEEKSEQKSEAKLEEKLEQKSEKAKEEKLEQKPEETKEEVKEEKPKQSEEPKQEPKAEESKPEPKVEEQIPETPVDNDMMDEIKPHSDVESDDSGSIIDDFPKVETPFLDDPTVRPASPVSSNTRPTSPTI